MIKKILSFTVLKYLYFFLNFVRGIYLARVLGPELYGIFGFWQMIQTYFGYLHFGIPYAINLELALNTKENKKYIVPGFWLLTLLVGIFIIILFTVYSVIPFDTIYNVPRYGLIATLGGITLIYREFFIDIHQVYKNYYRIVFGDLLTVSVLLSFPFFLTGDDLIFYTIIGFFVFSIIGILPLVRFRDISYFSNFNELTRFWGFLFKIGVPMFVANMTIYFTTLIPRAVLSFTDNLTELGKFTLSINIANAIMLGINTVSWTLYPTLLAKTNMSLGREEVEKNLELAEKVYPMIISGIVYLAVIVISMLINLLPKFSGINNVIAILLLSQIVYSFAFANITMLYSNKKYVGLVITSIVTSVFVLSFSIILFKLNVPLITYCLSVVSGYFIYSFLSIYFTNSTFTTILGKTNKYLFNKYNGIMLIACAGIFYNINLILFFAILFVVLIFSSSNELRVLFSLFHTLQKRNEQ